MFWECLSLSWIFVSSIFTWVEKIWVSSSPDEEWGADHPAIKAKADSFSFGNTDVEVLWNLYLEWPPPLHLSFVPYSQIIIYGPHTSTVAIEIEGQIEEHLWIALVTHLKGFVGADYFVLRLIAVVPVVFWTSTQDLKLLCVCLFVKVRRQSEDK